MTDIPINKIQNGLHNYTEDIVLEAIQELLAEEKYDNLCTCEQCLKDIATFALNRIPAKYIATEKGSVLTKIDEFEQQYQADMYRIITDAIDTVSSNPSQGCPRYDGDN